MIPIFPATLKSIADQFLALKTSTSGILERLRIVKLQYSTAVAQTASKRAQSGMHGQISASYISQMQQLQQHRGGL